MIQNYKSKKTRTPEQNRAAFFRFERNFEMQLAKEEITRLHNLNRQLEEKVALDKLTGLWTRSAATETIDNLIASAQRDQQPFVSFTVVDLDDFGKTNKRWGMAVGDLVLATVGKTIKKTIRPMDRAIRMGGEELLIVADGKNQSGALVLANRVRQAIADIEYPLPPDTVLQDAWTWPAGKEIPFDVVFPDKTAIQKGSVFLKESEIPVGSIFPKGLVLSVTASMGVSSIPRDQCPDSIIDFNPLDKTSFIGNVIDLCDQGLREAKNAGKNRCCISDTSLLLASPTLPQGTSPHQQANQNNIA